MEVAPPFPTCEPVLSESCFLLSGTTGGVNAVFELLQRQVIAVVFSLEEHVEPVAGLLSKYASVPMSLADACLVRMAELYSRSMVFTFDTDFSLYRKNRRQVIPTIMPEET